MLPEKPPTPIRCCRTPEEHDGEQARRRRCSSASSATFSRVHRATELGLEEERRSAAAAENHTSATAAAAGSTGGAGSSRRGINASRWSSFSRADHPVAEDHELGGTALRIPPFFVSASRAACCWGPLSCLSVVLLERSPRPSPSVRAAARRKKKGKKEKKIPPLPKRLRDARAQHATSPPKQWTIRRSASSGRTLCVEKQLV